ncbi:MAG: endonuclease/exonuclease/phosphatase family protein [Bacteroidetes bacterium]|nr:endonuclease/exonuclease/phosphatase family protein [Bacteroidota bacterium]
MFDKKILIIAVLCLAGSSVVCQSMEILTYNIRYDNPGDGINSWLNRRAWLCEQVNRVHPDILCIQEGLISQIIYLDSTFSDYHHIGAGREDGKKKGEFSAIYYNAKRIRVLKQATFWLSATPGKVSVGWDAALERICTYGLFQNLATGRKFLVFNTHFDHIGVEARKNSAKLILQKIKTVNPPDYPVILTGDFNAGPESEPILLISGVLLDSKIADKSMSMGPDGTFNGFDPEKPVTERIDFIFTSKKGIAVLNYGVIRESKDGRFASDHFPVTTEIKFSEQEGLPPLKKK